jgi:hypothetical protein
VKALRQRRIEQEGGSATWTRTKDHSINSRMLYQLSYRGTFRASKDAVSLAGFAVFKSESTSSPVRERAGHNDPSA